MVVCVTFSDGTATVLSLSDCTIKDKIVSFPSERLTKNDQYYFLIAAD